jgi:hypothetical protein
MVAMPIEERLAALHAHYVWRVNAAVAAGRMDLVRDLVDEYQDEVLEWMLEHEASDPNLGPAEILESAGGTPWWSQGADSDGTSRFRFWRRRSG